MRNKTWFVSLFALVVLLLAGCSGGGASPGATKPAAMLPTTAPATLVLPPPMPTAMPDRVTETVTPVTSVRVPSATNLPPGGITAHLNDLFTLQLSQWATLPDANNTRIFFTNVLEDTRCALDINCFQAGSVRVAVTVESGGELARFDLSSKPSDYRLFGVFNGYLVQFVDFGPARTTANMPIQSSEYRLTLRVRAESLTVSQARFNEPFTLKLGQSVGFEGSGMRLTFEAVKQDSRCPARTLCVTSGTAAVAVRMVYDSATQEQIILGVDGNPVMTSYPIIRTVSGSIRANALTPYPQQEFASKEITPSEYAVTLVVVNPAMAPTTPAARGTPTALATCPNLTRPDATEILGETLKEQPAEMILFQPPDSSISVRGLCGYASVAFTPNKPAPTSLPRVLPVTVQSDHAVVAEKLTNSRRQEQLLSIVSAMDAANPRGSSNLYMRLLVSYAAGTWLPDALGDFPDAARGATNVHVSKVGSLGESAIWVWREFDGGHYAALVAQKGETLLVVAALTDAQRAEDDLLATMTTVVQKMLR